VTQVRRPPLIALRPALYRWYWQAEKRITPRLRSSQYAYYERLRDALHEGSRWLDLGCGHQVFGEWMTREQQEVVGRSRAVFGIDLDWEGLRRHAAIPNRVSGDLQHLPFQTGSCDVVSANMVVEHLAEPARVLEEVHRVLRPRGFFVFHTPNYLHWGTLVAAALPDRVKKPLIWYLEEREEHDVFPVHYRMNTAQAVRRLAPSCGFRIAELAMVSTSAALKMLGPLVLLELLYIRLLDLPGLAGLRSNLVVVLQKVAESESATPPRVEGLTSRARP